MLDIRVMNDYNSSAAMKCKSLSLEDAQCAHFANELTAESRMYGSAATYSQKSRVFIGSSSDDGNRDEFAYCSTWNNRKFVDGAGQGVALSSIESHVNSVSDEVFDEMRQEDAFAFTNCCDDAQKASSLVSGKFPYLKESLQVVSNKKSFRVQSKVRNCLEFFFCFFFFEACDMSRACIFRHVCTVLCQFVATICENASVSRNFLLQKD
jgi:hypothetical protein